MSAGQDKPIDMKVYSKSGQLLPFTIPAYRSTVPGILVHEYYEFLGIWTVSHYTGHRLGGRYTSKDEAIEAAKKLGLTGADWTEGNIHKLTRSQCAFEAMKVFRDVEATKLHEMAEDANRRHNEAIEKKLKEKEEREQQMKNN